MHFFFCKRYIFPIFPLTFFWKLNGIYSWSLFLKLKNRKNSIFGKIFILLYLQITCYRDMQLTCVSIYQYGSSYIIKTLTGWNFYEERKHQGILSFYPERIIDKKDYWHKLFSKTSKKLNSWLPRHVKARQRCHRLLWITGCDTQYNSPEERKSAKFSQAACLDKDSSGTDADADLPGEANSAPPEPKQDKPKKKCSRKRQWTSEEANMEMCGKAVKMMSKIERILDKFDSDSSDEE